MKRAIVIGTGAGGATAAKELQGKFEVTVLEQGGAFHPFKAELGTVGKLKRTGVLFDERMVGLIYPNMRVRKSAEGMVLVNGIGAGGTTTICTGNGLRQDHDLKALGIDLDKEFTELYHDVPISTEHCKHWSKHTRQVYELCQEMQLQPVPTPKMAYGDVCAACGRCIFGCQRGAKWDSRKFLEQAVENGATLLSHRKAYRIVVRNGAAVGVVATYAYQTRFYPADLVVVAAGGFGTPAILQNSGIACQPKLFVDPVLCVAAKWKGSHQDIEIPMPFIVQKENFILSPYFDFLSFFFNKKWNCASADIYSLMIKLADTNVGGMKNRSITKGLSEIDRRRLNDGVSLCKDIFRRLGVKEEDTFLGTVNAGHPGGMLPLSAHEAVTLHHNVLPDNVYVADSTLFPESLGNPPMLTIMALAKKISKICTNKFAGNKFNLMEKDKWTEKNS